MRTYPLYFILILAGTAWAQNKKLDSLLHVKLSTKEDTNHVRHYNSLASAYKKKSFDSAIYWTDIAIQTAKRINSEKYLISSYHNKGVFYRVKADFKTALDTLLLARELSRVSAKKTNLIGINQDLGVVYRILGNFDKSILAFQEALKEAERRNHKGGLYNSYNSLANTYCQMGVSKRSVFDLERGLQYYKKAYGYIDTSNKDMMAMAKANSGVAYFNIGIFKKDSMALLRSKDLFMEGLKFRIDLGDSTGIAISYGNIAGAYHELCNISLNETYLRLSKKYYELALFIERSIGYSGIYLDESNYGGHLILMANQKKDKNLQKIAIEHLKRALEGSTKANDVLNTMNVHHMLAKVYQDIGAYEDANRHLNLYITKKDTLLNQENNQIAEELASKYESDLKDTENKNLKYQAELREEVISKKSTTINLMVIGSILLLGLIVMVLISRQKITKAKQLTEQQKLIIEEKNKEITDSINYAKRLQNTMLPGESSLGAMFAESFIFYRPKDIVSGDFYWYSRNGNNKMIVAAVDCTGHGVPGAFMSMLGITFLNEIVGQKNIGTPNLILGELRDRVKSTLKQRGLEGEARDGMDIAVINVDLEKNRLEFSGANNPIWLCRDNEVIEVHADKRPIGYFKGQGLPFTNHSVELKKGDGVYLFTDGYADQFGGPKGKKFKYKTLSDLLLGIHQKSCSEQKQILEKTFADWKGDLDQVDDVLILGIKI